MGITLAMRFTLATLFILATLFRAWDKITPYSFFIGGFQPRVYNRLNLLKSPPNRQAS